MEAILPTRRNPRSVGTHGSHDAALGLHWPLLRGRSPPGAPDRRYPLRHHRILTALASLGLATAGLALVGQSAEAADSRCNRTNDSLRKLLECVTLDGVMEHQEAFQRIADANGGTRASGTPGLRRLGRLRRGPAGTRRLRRDPTGVRVPRLRGRRSLDPAADGTDPDDVRRGHRLRPTPQSEPGEVTAAVVPVDINLTLPRANTSGCEAADFAGFPAGSIALLQRGTCTFAQKGNTAAAGRRRRHHLLQPGQRPQRPAGWASRRSRWATATPASIPAVSATYALGASGRRRPG